MNSWILQKPQTEDGRLRSKLNLRMVPLSNKVFGAAMNWCSVASQPPRHHDVLYGARPVRTARPPLRLQKQAVWFLLPTSMPLACSVHQSVNSVHYRPSLQATTSSFPLVLTLSAGQAVSRPGINSIFELPSVDEIPAFPTACCSQHHSLSAWKPPDGTSFICR